MCFQVHWGCSRVCLHVCCSKCGSADEDLSVDGERSCLGGGKVGGESSEEDSQSSKVVLHGASVGASSLIRSPQGWVWG